MDLTKASVKRPYEVVILMHPDTTVDEQKELFRKNKATIEGYKGSIFSLDTWGKTQPCQPDWQNQKGCVFSLPL